MKKHLFYSLAIFAVLFAFRSQGQNFVQVTKANTGQTITLSTDQVLELQLPKRPSNGYTWVETTSSLNDKAIQKSIAQIGDDEWIPDEATKGTQIVGQLGTEVLRYTGTTKGTTVISLELRRPWDKNSQVLDNFTVTIVSAGKYTGTYTPTVKEMPKHVTSTPKSVPSKWDWRSQCTPIENQNACGDCWAYATVGTLECNIKIHDGVTRDISEEFVTDCYTASNCSGCNGGLCAHQAWLSTYKGANSNGGGAVYETDDPTTCNNTGQTGTCKTGLTPHETIDSYADVSGENSNGIPPDANIKQAIYDYGPIWIAMDASSSSFNNYTGGIWTVTGSSTDHAVILAGWVDSSTVSGGGYWILRNSWGPSWGINGYMYISYGSALVGTYADYIVYKGGISHNTPPVASFTASSTSSCTGVVQFTDGSSNTPTSWAWTFGDGTTSTLQNPSHTYTTNGTYGVTLKATNAYGNNTSSATSITISLPTAPTITNGATTSGGSVTLHASGTGTLNWYNAATGGTIVNTGTSYMINPLTTNKTFYVENDVTQAAQSVGIASSTLSTSTGGYYTSTARQGLLFDALTALTIQTVTVYEKTAGSRVIFLKNSGGTVIDSLVTTVSAGQQTITLNFPVPAGTGYTLGAAAGSGLWRQTSGAVYPYTIANVISITGNTASSAGYYYYFYNWQVSGASCTSARVPVTASIITGINEYSDGNINIYPIPNQGIFNITLDNSNSQNITVSILNVLGAKLLEKEITDSTNPIQIDASNLKEGMYFVEVKTNKSTYLRKITITK